MTRDVDVVVVGLGPGGEDVAGSLASAGLVVVGVEAELVGGECPYWACVPSKMMIRAANVVADARRAPLLAGTVSLVPDFSVVARRIRDEATDDWDDKVAADRFTGKGGILVRGRGELVSRDTVRVGDEEYRARRGIVIATGSSPVIPPIEGLAETPYWTNREAVSATEAPSSLVVLGGGAVGCELAQVFARFGSKVTIIEAGDRLLPGEVAAAGELIGSVFAAEGIAVRTGDAVTAVSHDGTQFRVVTGAGSVEAERLLVATGRRANLRNLGLGTAGLSEDLRVLPVDGQLVAAPGIWAVGDVTGAGAFTHTAIYQAGIATQAILGTPTADADYRALPRVTFTDPEVGAVGLTPDAAREQGRRVRVGTVQVSVTSRGWIHGPGNDGFIQVVEDADEGVLVGATSVGPEGGEVLGMLSVAVQARVPVRELGSTIFAYPTFHRGVADALRALTDDPQ